MEVRTGYKQTDVGFIPTDWSIKILGKNCDLITKGTTPTSIGRSFESTGINFFKAETISGTGKINTDRVTFISEETHAVMKRSQLKHGDLLISIAGVLGRVGIIDESNLPANVNQALAIIRLGKQSEIERIFFILCFT